MRRSRLVPVALLAISALALVAIFALQARSNDARTGQLELADVEATLVGLNAEPMQAATSTVAIALTRVRIDAGARAVQQRVERLRAAGGPPELAPLDDLIDRNRRALEAMLVVGAGRPSMAAIRTSARAAGDTGASVRAALNRASDAYAERASAARMQASAGTAASVLLLVAAFALLYGRAARARRTAERLTAENARLLAASRIEARSDALTGLANRRALLEDLADATAPDAPPSVLALFDLDGFKGYNDAHGHPAGDVLLRRLGQRLQAAVPAGGRTYRLGGDEFCLLAPARGEAGRGAVVAAAKALAEPDVDTPVAASCGMAAIPREAATPSDALRLADRRMYAHKGRMLRRRVA